MRTIPPFDGWYHDLEHHQNRFARGLERYVREGDSWLDVGAGTKLHDGWLGLDQSALASRSSTLVGCDLEIEHLHRNPFLTSAVGASLYELPFVDNSFDLISANMVVEHLEHPDRAFREVERVLRPGGRFLFVTPNVNNPVIRVASLLLHRRVRTALAHLVEKRAMEHIFPTFYAANTPVSVKKLSEEAKLAAEVVEVFQTWPFLKETPVLREIELAYMKAVDLLGGGALGTNLFVVLSKPR